MVSACSRAKVWRRDWKIVSWVARVEACVERRVAPCVAYCVERELWFLKAPRPTPRRVDMVVVAVILVEVRIWMYAPPLLVSQ